MGRLEGKVAVVGFIETPIFEAAGLSAAEKDGFLEAAAAKSSLGRVGQPDDIASAVVYLASGESSFVTGSEILIDGGYTIVGNPV
jgi:NAD(P)-dependent dehydrogenase (short-subunit alcohol dehydrogenase family)